GAQGTKPSHHHAIAPFFLTYSVNKSAAGQIVTKAGSAVIILKEPRNRSRKVRGDVRFAQHGLQMAHLLISELLGNGHARLVANGGEIRVQSRPNDAVMFRL